MLVSDVMSEAPASDAPQESVRAAASRMWGQQTGPLVVVVDGRLLGTMTDRDVVEAVARGLDVDDVPVHAVMNRQALTVGPDLPLATAAALMGEHRLAALPVVRDGAVVGMLRQADVVTALGTAVAPAQVLDLDAPPVDPYVEELPTDRAEQV